MFKFPVNELGSVINAKDRNALITEILDERAKNGEMLVRFIARFHKIKRNVPRITIDEKNKVTIRRETKGKGTTNVAMNAFEKTRGGIGRFLGKR